MADCGDQHEPATCARCSEQRELGPEGLCSGCGLGLVNEVALGMNRLGDYLAKWAAFDDWQRTHPAG
jgi:predicted amidophosphoribosyltransferase